MRWYDVMIWRDDMIWWYDMMIWPRLQNGLSNFVRRRGTWEPYPSQPSRPPFKINTLKSRGFVYAKRWFSKKSSRFVYARRTFPKCAHAGTLKSNEKQLCFRIFSPSWTIPQTGPNSTLFKQSLIFQHPILDYRLKVCSSIFTFQFGSFRAPHRLWEACQCWNHAIWKCPQAIYKLFIL